MNNLIFYQKFFFCVILLFDYQSSILSWLLIFLHLAISVLIFPKNKNENILLKANIVSKTAAWVFCQGLNGGYKSYFAATASLGIIIKWEQLAYVLIHYCLYLFTIMTWVVIKTRVMIISNNILLLRVSWTRFMHVYNYIQIDYFLFVYICINDYVLWRKTSSVPNVGNVINKEYISVDNTKKESDRGCLFEKKKSK